MLRAFQGILPKVGENAFVEETAVVVGDVVIGAESSVWFLSVVRADVNFVKIGNRTNIQDLCVLHVTHDTHPLIIGDEVTVGHHVVLHGCTIQDRVLVGMGAILMDGVVIGEECIIGAGALITEGTVIPPRDRKSTRLNSSHRTISYAVFCLKKKNKIHDTTPSG